MRPILEYFAKTQARHIPKLLHARYIAHHLFYFIVADNLRAQQVSKIYRRRLGRVRNKNIKMADERDPAERVRKLVQFAGQVEVDNSIAPKKYFRSGVEMERMVSISLYVFAEVSNRCPNLQQISHRDHIRYVRNGYSEFRP